MVVIFIATHPAELQPLRDFESEADFTPPQRGELATPNITSRNRLVDSCTGCMAHETDLFRPRPFRNGFAQGFQCVVGGHNLAVYSARCVVLNS